MAEVRNKYLTGCSGWSYKSWVGPFYPKGTKAKDFLRLYSTVFDAVEIDSTFYSIPESSVVSNWYSSTGDHFTFTAKLPKTITHERKLINSGTQLSFFLESIGKLKEKLGCILVQMPHSFKYDHGFQNLGKFVKELPGDAKFAFEFRDPSWFTDDVYSLLSDAGMTLAWSDTPFAVSPDCITSKTGYLRLVGDRKIEESDFGKVQRDKSESLSFWGKKLSARIMELEEVFIFSNNHYQGFGPATVNSMRKELGLEEVKWDASPRHELDSSQKSIFDWG